MVLRQEGNVTCSGVIIDALHVLTAAHCLYGDSNSPAPASQFTIEAGVSNFKDPSQNGTEQVRRVARRDDHARLHHGRMDEQQLGRRSRARPGSVDPLPSTRPGRPRCTSSASPNPKEKAATSPRAALTSSSPGYGEENTTSRPNGSLNEDIGLIVHPECNTNRVFCVWSSTSATCLGDSGAALVEPGSPATVVEFNSTGNAFDDCSTPTTNGLEPSSDYSGGYIFFGGAVYVGSHAALQFIDSSR